MTRTQSTLSSMCGRAIATTRTTSASMRAHTKLVINRTTDYIYHTCSSYIDAVTNNMWQDICIAASYRASTPLGLDQGQPTLGRHTVPSSPSNPHNNQPDPYLENIQDRGVLVQELLSKAETQKRRRGRLFGEETGPIRR